VVIMMGRKRMRQAVRMASTASSPARRRSGAKVEIAVVDRGIGIGDEDRARVFEPFYRTDRSRARETGGVGLGLALARRIIEADAGEIAFESRSGHGSRFVVTLNGVAREP
jgi:signal transduction histidine kinase